MTCTNRAQLTYICVTKSIFSRSILYRIANISHLMGFTVLSPLLPLNRPLSKWCQVPKNETYKEFDWLHVFHEPIKFHLTSWIRVSLSESSIVYTMRRICRVVCYIFIDKLLNHLKVGNLDLLPENVSPWLSHHSYQNISR